MKEFNLKEALAGKPVQTRSGKPVRITQFYNTYNGKKRLFIMGFIQEISGEQHSTMYTEWGLFEKEEKDDADLMMAD